MNKNIRIAKYETVFDELKAQLEHYETGKRLPTVRDLMNEFGASQVTVDRALDMLESKKLITRKNGHGIFKASPLKNGREALVVGLAASNFSSAATDMFVTALTKAIHEAGHCVQLFRYDWKERIIRSLPNRDCDALLLFASSEDLMRSDITRLKAFGIPFLTIDSPLAECNMNSICTDNRHGGALAAVYLSKLGHKKLALLIGEPWHKSIEARIEGFSSQCALLGLPPPQIINCDVKTGEYSFEATFKYTEKFIRSGKLDASAVFCVSDGTAIGFLHSLYEAGINVPSDLSVLGFDGIREGAFLNPSLSTVSHNLKEMGVHAINFLNQISAKEQNIPSLRASVAPTILERKSTSRFSGKKS